MKFNLISAMALAVLPLTLSAQDDTSRLIETRAFYSTNADEAVGKAASITIDGSFSDWSDDMIVATCGANDMCTTFNGSHENCVIDLYAVYAAWDDANLYLAWQMCNTGDTWARPGDGPLTDGGRIGDVPIIVALSLDPSSVGMTGKLTDGRFIWGDGASGVNFSSHADRLLFMSAKAGSGEPAMFLAADAAGNSNYGDACKTFRSVGITYAMAQGFAPAHLWRQRTVAEWADATTLISSPDVINNIYDAENYDNLMAGTPSGLKKHDTTFDSFFEMKIPMTALGINREWLEANGIGVRVVGTRGESGIDCCPFDPSMVDNVFGEYAKDNSTSHEKDDVDIITYELASVGKIRTGSVDPLPNPNPGPTPDPDPVPAEDGNYVVYFDNSTSNWSSVFTWIWDAAEGNKNYTGGSWPGTTMSADPESGYYKYSFDCTNESPKLMCIFNPGGDNGKTADLDLVNYGVYNAQGYTGKVYSGIDDVSVATDYTVSGRTVTLPAPGALYNMQGVKIAEGTVLTAPAPGLYILAGATTVKLMLR